MSFKAEIYLIADFSYGIDKIEEALSVGVDAIQLREKNITSREYYLRAVKLRELTRIHHTKLIINDRLDIAMLSQADGVHLGESDLPASEARQLAGERFCIGVTAKTLEQAKAGQKAGADYIGSGAWFPTGTKEDAVLLPREVFKKIREAVTIPIVAVGGIQAENCEEALAQGADGLAVSAGILASDDISSAILSFRIKFSS